MLPLLFAASARHLTGLNDLRGAQSIFSVIDKPSIKPSISMMIHHARKRRRWRVRNGPLSFNF